MRRPARPAAFERGCHWSYRGAQGEGGPIYIDAVSGWRFWKSPAQLRNAIVILASGRETPKDELPGWPFMTGPWAQVGECLLQAMRYGNKIVTQCIQIAIGFPVCDYS